MAAISPEAIEHRKQQQREYYQRNRDKWREWAKQHRNRRSANERNYRQRHATEVKRRKRIYRETHAEEIRQKKQQRYQDNKEQIQEKDRAYYQANADRIKERVRSYGKANRTTVSEKNAMWAAKNPEKVRQSRRTWAKNNPDKARARRRSLRAARLGAKENAFTGEQWRDMKAHYGHRCVYCGRKTVALTQDHILPLSKGGPHIAQNIVPACRSCNAKKGRNSPPIPVQPVLFLISSASS
jgi:hypothetical protein